MPIATGASLTDPKSESWNDYTDNDLKIRIKRLAAKNQGGRSTAPGDLGLLAKLSPDSLNTVLAAAGREFCIAILCDFTCQAVECAGSQ